MQAIGDSVIIKLHHKDKIGSIYIPEKAQAQGADFYGEVMSIGSEFKFDVKIGDKLIYFRNEGFKFTHEEEEYLRLDSRHVMGVIV